MSEITATDLGDDETTSLARVMQMGQPPTDVTLDSTYEDSIHSSRHQSYIQKTQPNGCGVNNLGSYAE